MSLQIQQKASLERQAFIAEMAISNGLTTSAITGVGVNVLFSDAAGNPVVATTDPNNTTASFFLRQDSLSGINAVDGSGTVAPSSNATIRWLIIPAPGTGGTSPGGALYSVGATLTYTLDGQVQTVNVAPANITVLPQPLLQLDYFLPTWVYADDPFTLPVEPPVPFTLGVRVTNGGWGTAKKLTIDSAQPKIVDNKQGLLIDFQLLDSYVNDQPAAKTLLMNFGDVAPQQAKMGRWDMETTLSGQFIDFSASFTHADSLGGALTSLISGVTTHFLVHDVLVDLPGRDGILDFLALDGGVLRVYESDGPNTGVVDSSVNASLSAVSGGQATLTFPSGTGLVYVRLTDPFGGQAATVAATRSDGKALSAANAWFSKERNTSGNWVYYVNLFDSNPTGKYTLATQGATNTGSITGVMFNDANNNGVQDSGESGLSGVGVHLHGTASAATVDLDTITDSTGNFQFSNLAAGTYSLTASAVPSYGDGTATSGSAGGASSPGTIQSIQLASGATASGYRFAKVPQSVSASSDFALALAAGASHVAVGGNLTLTATLSNAGPAANSASVAFRIPSGLIMGGATASSGSFDAGSRTWQVGTLGSGSTATLSLVVQGYTAGSQTIQATAVAGSAATDPNLQNNSASAVVTVDDVANLTLFKSGPATMVPSASAAYTLALGNSGGGASGASATVTDILPAGASYVSAVPGINVSQVACTGTTTLTCTVTLANALAAHSANGAATFTINTLAPAASGTITNYAAVDPTGGTNPPTPGIGCSSSQCGQATTVVSSSAAQANLTLAKSAPASAGTGSQVGYTLALGNAGQAQSGTTVTVADALPAGMAYVSALPGTNVSSVTCTGAPTLSCTVTLTTPLSAGAASGAATFAINATAPNTAGTITNYASIDPAGGTNPPSPGTGCTPAASCGSATTTVSVITPPTAFTLVKKAPASATLGASVVYEIDLGNSGQSASGTTATITDVLPAGTTYVSATPGTNVSGVTCTGTTTLTCTATLAAALPAGAANGAAVFTINATAPGVAGTITNYASVDPAGGTNPPQPGTSCVPAASCGSATTTVNVPPAVFTLVKKAPATVNTGAGLAYEIDLGNSGQGTSGTTATISDVLPAGVSYVSAAPGTNMSSVTCTGTTTLTCTATLAAPLSAGAANGAAKFTINTTAPSTTGTITNYASVDSSGGTNPPTPGSACTTANCGSATTTVNVPPPAVFTLAKQSPATANTGSTLVYEIDLGNSGQGASGTSATITDVLPAGVIYVGAAPGANVSSVACTGTTTLTCTATLAVPLSAGTANGAAKFTINTTAPSVAGTITNYASVDSTGGTNPPTPGSACTTANCGSATTTVRVPPPPSAVFTLAKQAPTTANTGSTLVYEIDLGNSGQGASGTSATITDVLPAGVSYVSASPGANVSGVTCTGTTTLTCTATLTAPLSAGAANGAAKFTINTTAPSAAGTITNYASVDSTGGTSPPAPGSACTTSNCGSATTTVNAPPPAANITLWAAGTASAGITGLLNADRSIVYEIGLGNSGQLASPTTITVAVTIPSLMTFVSATAGANVSNVKCQGLPTGICTITLIAPLQAGAGPGSATFRLGMISRSAAPRVLTSYLSVDPTGGANPPAPGANCSPVSSCGAITTNVFGRTSDWETITLSTKASAFANTNGTLAYMIGFGNVGSNSSGTSLTFADALPDGATFAGLMLGSSIASASCTGTTLLTCSVTLTRELPGDSIGGSWNYASLVIYTSTPATPGVITNYLSVDPTGGANPPTPGPACTQNASCSSATTMLSDLPAGSANITLTKTGPSSASSNAPPTYVISLGNSGHSASGTVVTVADLLPVGMTAPTFTPGAGVSSVGCQNLALICTVTLSSPLQPGAAIGTAAFTVSTNVANTAATLTNYASVDSTGGTNPPLPGADCTPAASCGSATTTISAVPPPAVFTLSQQAPATANTGSTLVYEIDLGNSGQGASGTTATITDVLPAGVSYVSASPGTNVSSVACAGGTTLTCTATLTAPLSANAASGAAKFTINTIAPSAAGTITNYASVDSTGGASPPAPDSTCTTANCGSATTTINSAPPAPNIILWATGPTNIATSKLTQYSGDADTYQISLGNSGQLASLTTITVTESVPAGMSLAGANAGTNVSSVQCQGSPTAVCTVTLINPLPAGAALGSATLKLTYSPLSASQTITHYYSVDPSGGASPPAPGVGCTPASSCGAVTTNVIGRSSSASAFALETTVSPFAHTNGALAYGISLGNTGTAVSGTSLTFAVALPNGAAFTGIVAGNRVTSATCTGTTSLTCSVTLASGLPANSWKAASLVIYASTPATAGVITNYLSVDPSGGTSPPAPGPACTPTAGCDSATTRVTDLPAGSANITLTKTGPSSASSSAPPAYVIGLGNSGQSASGTTITVADLLPAGMTAQTYIPGAGVSSVACSGSSLLICTVTLSSPLQPGAAAGTAAFTVYTNVANAAATLVNYASADPSGGANPPQPGPNCSPSGSCGSASTAISVSSNSINDGNWFESLAGLIPPSKKESQPYAPSAIDRPVRRLLVERQSTSFFMPSRISTQGSM